MNALRQRQLTEDSLRKPPDKERKAVSTSLENFGREPIMTKGRLVGSASCGLCRSPKAIQWEVCLRFIWLLILPCPRSPREVRKKPGTPGLSSGLLRNGLK